MVMGPGRACQMERDVIRSHETHSPIISSLPVSPEFPRAMQRHMITACKPAALLLPGPSRRRAAFFPCTPAIADAEAASRLVVRRRCQEEKQQQGGGGGKPEKRTFLSLEEAGLVEMSGLSTHERFLCRLTISSLNLLRVISEQEGVAIEELNAGRVCDWFLKDKLKQEQNLDSAVLQWDDPAV